MTEDLKKRVEEISELYARATEDRQISIADKYARVDASRCLEQRAVELAGLVIGLFAENLAQKKALTNCVNDIIQPSSERECKLELQVEALTIVSRDLLQECEYHINSTHCPLGLGRDIYRNAKATLTELGLMG